MGLERLNGYHIMWLFVFFDLPVETKLQRRNATKFRNNLLKSGFTMMQFSVYTRCCASLEAAEVAMKKVKNFMVKEGLVSVLMVTDKQFGNIQNFWGGGYSPPKAKTGAQLELF